MHQLPDSVSDHRTHQMVLLTGLYLFLCVMTITSYGQPIPVMGIMLEHGRAEVFIAIDSLITLYLFLGLWKRQVITWHLLLACNLFEVINISINLWKLDHLVLERVLERSVDPQGLLLSNISTIVLIGWVSRMIWLQRPQFCNRSPYLF